MNEEQFEIFVKGEDDFKFFVNNIFSQSFDRFIEGQHVDDTADFLGQHKRTMRVSAKDHFKSTSLYAHFMWRLLYRPGYNAHYFSYQEQMSAYHIAKIRDLINRNPFYEDFVDLKPTAEGVLKYALRKDDGTLDDITSLQPHGLLAFKRGIHDRDIYVDDPFQDPENKLNPTVIQKINRIFVSQIMDMPFQAGELHVVGTPQTTEDFFFNEDITQRFAVKILPAIVDEQKKEVLWKEYMPFEELVHRRSERGEKLFNQEYMCTPVWLEHAYFSKEQINRTVNSSLEMHRALETDNKVFLGWDPGKKVHPGFVCIFELVKKTLVMRYYRFFDHVDYSEQLNEVRGLMKRFSVDLGCYDATRGEFETFEEKREMPSNLEPVVFKRTRKFEMANLLDIRVNHKHKDLVVPTIEIFNDQRLINQLLVVDNDLNALETHEGHGDAFWGIALAVYAADSRKTNLIIDFG